MRKPPDSTNKAKKMTNKTTVVLWFMLASVFSSLKVKANTNCFEGLLLVQQKAISSIAIQKKIKQVTGTKVRIQDALDESDDLLIYAFGKFRSLDEKILKYINEGEFIYDLNGNTGKITLKKDAFGKTVISEVYNHGDSDQASVTKVMYAMMERDYGFSSQTRIHIQHNPSGRFGGVQTILDETLDLRSPPSFLVRSSQRSIIEEEEVLKAGSVLKSKAEEALKDGEYVFMTLFNSRTGKYRTIQSPAYSRQEDGKFYVTHRTLLRKFKQANEVLVSAGEFQIRFGEFAKLSNRSGTYKSNLNHLNHAQTTFEDMGYDLSRTTFVDYAALRRAQTSYSDELEEAGVHSSALYRAQTRHSLLTDEKNKEVFVEAYLMIHRLHKNFPGEKFGQIDKKRVMAFLKENSEFTPETPGYQLYMSMFLDIIETDSLSLAISNSMRTFDTREEMLDTFKFVMDLVPIKL